MSPEEKVKELEQKIKEFELVLKQEYKAQQYLTETRQMYNLLTTYQEHFNLRK